MAHNSANSAAKATNNTTSQSPSPTSDSPVLIETYDIPMYGIDDLPLSQRSTATAAIAWVYHAKSPLRPALFLDALAVWPGYTHTHADERSATDEILELCQGILQINSTTRCVDFTTCEMRGLLDEECKHFWWVEGKEKARGEIAKGCVGYLLREEVMEEIERHGEDLLGWRCLGAIGWGRFQFIQYAGHYWGVHAAEDKQRDVMDLVAAALSNERFVRNAVMCLMHDLWMACYPHTRKGKKVLWSGIHLLAYFGIMLPIWRLLPPSQKDGTKILQAPLAMQFTKGRESPLYVAAKRGHAKLISGWIKTGYLGGQFNMARQLEAAVVAAARNYHTGIVKKLLNYTDGLKPLRVLGWDYRHIAFHATLKNSVYSDLDDLFMTDYPEVRVAPDTSHLVKALHIRPARRRKAIRRRMGKNTNMNQIAWLDDTPLRMAAMMGSTDMLRELLESGADINLARDGCGSALDVAVCCGHIDTVKFLLDSGAKISSTTLEVAMIPMKCNFPVDCSFAKQADSIVKLLLDSNQDSGCELEALSKVINLEYFGTQPTWIMTMAKRIVKRCEVTEDLEGFAKLFRLFKDDKLEWPSPAPWAKLARLRLRGTDGEWLYFHLDKQAYAHFIGSDPVLGMQIMELWSPPKQKKRRMSNEDAMDDGQSGPSNASAAETKEVLETVANAQDDTTVDEKQSVKQESSTWAQSLNPGRLFRWLFSSTPSSVEQESLREKP